jgi:hypothetical protein
VLRAPASHGLLCLRIQSSGAARAKC